MLLTYCEFFQKFNLFIMVKYHLGFSELDDCDKLVLNFFFYKLVL